MSDCKECGDKGYTSEQVPTIQHEDGDWDYVTVDTQCGSCPYGETWRARQDRMDTKRIENAGKPKREYYCYE